LPGVGEAFPIGRLARIYTDLLGYGFDFEFRSRSRFSPEARINGLSSSQQARRAFRCFRTFLRSTFQ
jgi:hypothetical protein